MKRLVTMLAACALAVAGCLFGSTPTANPHNDGLTDPAEYVTGDAFSINAGGMTKGTFAADRYYSGGATYGTSFEIDLSQITRDPPPSSVFNSERYGSMTYTIPNRSGPQTVILYFTESYVTSAGQRVFSVTINGTTVLSDFDIFASAGGSNRAIARAFNTTADAGGNVVVRFIPGIENPKINGITVVGSGTTPTLPPPTATPTPAAPPTTSPDARSSAGCGRAPTLRNGAVSVQSDGARSYVLRVPDNYDLSHSYRLVLAYHWRGGTARDVSEGTGATESAFFGLWDLAGNSTIFVAPVGLGSGNDTGWPNAGGRDVAFTDAILAQIEADLCIDTTRIFATGFSYGAGMSYALACARPDVFRGVAILSGAELSGCTGGTKPIAFYGSHGVGDSVLDISQGRRLRDHFVQVNGIAAQEAAEPEPGSGKHVCTKYAGGSGKYPVEWCAFDGDHTPNPHDANEPTSWNPPEVWAFISQF